jgi:hypothetical protein
MRVLGGGGGGGRGTFVGLHATAATHLAVRMALEGSEARCTAGRLAGLLAQAGDAAGGVDTPSALRRLDAFLCRTAEDLRWRVAVVAGDHPGEAVGFPAFASAAAARADGTRYGRLLEEAMQRYWDAYDTDGEDAAAAEFLALVQGMSAYDDDPAWSAGVVNHLGSDGFSNAVWVAKGDAPGDVARMRATVGPLFAALSVAMEHRLADPGLRRSLLAWPHYDLALVLALAPAATGFLTTAAKQMLVDATLDGDRSNDLDAEEYALVFAALAEKPEAAFRVLTGRDRYGFGNVTHIVIPWDVTASPEATQSLGHMLEAGLVEYPSSRGRREWDLATAATEDVMHLVARMVNLTDDVHPDFNASLAALLRPHLDAIAVTVARAHSSHAPGDLADALPTGRRALDVDVDTLERYLGATMQQDTGIAAVQLLLAAYSQQPGVQANRLPLLSQRIGSIRELDAFATDSVRIAALAGLVGAGLDVAGKDEESVTRLLVGALDFASGKATGLLPAGRHPAVWLAQRGARYLAGEGIEEFERWLQDREPLEGEDGVGTFLTAYTDTTVASLREHIATDPELSRLSADEQAELLDSVRFWVAESVRGPLLEPYAELVGETAGE